MKKNWFQILSLALNMVLLAALLVTRAELLDTQTILKSQLDGIAWRLSDMDNQITDLSAKQREQTENLADFSLEPTGLDPETHTLQADMKITLRRWTANTAVTLLITQNGQTAEQPMTGADGVFTAPVSLPVEQTGGVTFAVRIMTGGQTSREEVTGYSDIAMLLPLVSFGNGSVAGPSYRKESACMEIGLDVELEKQYGAKVIEPVFQVRKNGDVVQEIPAKLLEESIAYSDPDKEYYAPDAVDEKLEIPCQSDTIEIHLLCQDSFGLSYDFTVRTYEIGTNGDIAEIQPVTDYNVEVSWD
ncbi:MAG: hypothetical protein EGQ09_05435 [Clostridiales bacterium]|nr:hypothetical protein [Clostridiales bacterium]